MNFPDQRTSWSHPSWPAPHADMPRSSSFILLTCWFRSMTGSYFTARIGAPQLVLLSTCPSPSATCPCTFSLDYICSSCSYHGRHDVVGLPSTSPPSPSWEAMLHQTHAAGIFLLPTLLQNTLVQRLGRIDRCPCLNQSIKRAGVFWPFLRTPYVDSLLGSTV